MNRNVGAILLILVSALVIDRLWADDGRKPARTTQNTENNGEMMAPPMQGGSMMAPIGPPASRQKSGASSAPRSANGAVQSQTKISKATSDHWAFEKPISRPAPEVSSVDWGRDELDRFILAKLEEKNLQPNPDADRYTLLRRISCDLTGLPPTEEEIRSFVQDRKSIDKLLPEVIDRYLASPRFGERWGRHWLDVVRYADSVGRNWNAPFNYAWRYRNYVIDAFNQDLPFNEFITEQLAGDLLSSPDVDTRRSRLIATGFLALGPMNIIEPEGDTFTMDRIDEQIDVTTRAILGLTVACARCHDHKYEPVSMKDYYALAGIFYSTEVLSGQRRGNYVAEDDLVRLPTENGTSTLVPGVHSMSDLSNAHQTGGYREVLWTTDPNLAMAAFDDMPQNCPIRLDGDANKFGQTPERGDFHFAGLSGLRDIPANTSGRLQLAHWMTSLDNPLTARVMVNRVWQHLFGKGLVETVDNFGTSGADTKHQDLLDHLALRFQKTWSVKSLIREIMLSRVYRLSSDGVESNQAIDAANEYYWKMNRKRLEVEVVRDSLLLASNRLSFERPDGIQMAGVGGKGRWGVTRSLLELDDPYRTVYLPVLRSLLPEMYSTFDFPDPTQVIGQREVTTVAPQALFLMNSEFCSRACGDIAQGVLSEAGPSHPERIQMIYLRLYGREPDRREINAAIGFMSSLTGQQSELYYYSVFVQALVISGEFRTLL